MGSYEGDIDRLLLMRAAGSSDNEIAIRLSGIDGDASPEEVEDWIGNLLDIIY